jgi:hypothetical protein
MNFPFFVSQDELKENCTYCNRIPWEVKSSGQHQEACTRTWYPRLQALENLRDLTLEAWNHVFSRKLLF